MKSLKDRVEKEIDQQFYLVKSLLEETKEGETTIKELQDIVEKRVHDFRLIKNILGSDPQEQRITGKIIAIQVALRQIAKGDIDQALYALVHQEGKNQ